MPESPNVLFEKIPENLFSVLAGPLKEVHAGLLFLVYEQYRRTIYTLPRETVIDLFCEYLESADMIRWPEDAEEEEAEEEEPLPVQSVRDRANLLFRKLADAGWLIQEQHHDYTFKITLPDYALALLETLDKINTGYRMEFQGKVLSIYQNLTGEEGMTYVALQQAREYTFELIDGLKRLSHSIRGYTEKLLEKKDPHDIMAHIFDEYHVQVLGEQYYRLKTSEHISKYRTGILSQVKEWQANRSGIMSEAGRMVEERQADDRLVAENQIYDWLDFIDDSFREMDELLDEIDRRNAQYARSAVEKLRFQLQQGRGVEQNLVAVLRSLADRARQHGEYEEAAPEVNRLIRIFPQRVIDEFSIKTPSRQVKEHNPRPQEQFEVSREVRNAKLERFRRRVQDEVNVEDINRYVLDYLRERPQMPLSELPVYTREQWVKLIYTLLYSRSRRARYLLTGEKGKTVKAGDGKAEVPALILERKDN